MKINRRAIVDPYRRYKRIFIAVSGGTVLVLGVALLVLPGPAFIVIPAGLAILAVEFAWARRWLRKLKSYLPKRKTGEQGNNNSQKPQNNP